MLAPANRAQTVRSEPSEVEEKIVRALRGTMYQPALNPLSTRIGAPCCRFRPRLQSFSRGFITPDSNQSDDKVQLDRTRLPRLTWMMSLGLITTNRVAARAIFSYFVKRGASPPYLSLVTLRGDVAVPANFNTLLAPGCGSLHITARRHHRYQKECGPDRLLR